MNRKVTCYWTLAAVLIAGAGAARTAGATPAAHQDGPHGGQEASGKHPAAAPAHRAVVLMEARSGSSLTGSAEFIHEDGKVTLKLEVGGIAPGVHAVHIHEKGDCSAPDASSAGGHWNPSGEAHGKWGAAPFHHGDIGNLTVSAEGRGTLLLTTDLWTLGGGGVADIVGRSVIVHANEDDFKTQPTGNSGGRIGCGVIKAE